MNEAIENAINAKCSKENEPFDFTDEEKEYIRVNYASVTWLFYWFESNASDGCWTENNYQFMTTFYHATTRIYRVCHPANNV
jgi:hypothetical protein